MAKHLLPEDFSGTQLAFDEFFEDFMTTAAGFPDAPQVPGDFFDGIPEDQQERDMCEPFIKLFVGAFELPGLKWSTGASQQDPASEKDNQPIFDVGLHSSTVDLEGLATLYESVQLLMELRCETSIKTSLDAFVDSGLDSDKHKESESTGESRRPGQGRLADYILEQVRHQHRKFVFAGSISGSTVCFYRYDFAGVIVSESVNFKETPQVLFDFLWRFAHMSDFERGWDETVRRANQREDATVREKLAPWKGDHVDFPTNVIWVPVDQTKTSKLNMDLVYRADPCGDSAVIDSEGPPADGHYYRKFLAWIPFDRPHSLMGRGTYCYPVYEEKTNKCCLLKEQWRANQMEKEGDILSDLNAKHVKNVPIYLCGDDVPGHMTVTDTYTDLPNGSTEPRIHYRFVGDIIATPLDTFTSSRQLMQAIFDAYIAHKEAFTKCHILHRDISIRNIMLVRGDHGILNDWDLCIRLDRDNKSPRQKERTGTWPFMSIGLLRNHQKLHVAQDDMESFLYVLLRLGLAHLKNSKHENGKLDSFMQAFFDINGMPGDEAGNGKIVYFTYGPSITFTDCPPMTTFLKSAALLVRRYLQWASDVEESGQDLSSVTIPEAIALRNHDALEGLFEAALAAEDDFPVVADRQDGQWSPPSPGALASMRTESTYTLSANGSVHTPPAAVSVHGHRNKRSQRSTKRGRDESDAPTEGSQGKKTKTTTPTASTLNNRDRTASQSTTSTLI